MSRLGDFTNVFPHRAKSHWAMDNRKLKFRIGLGTILAVLGWEAVSGLQQSQTYHVAVHELTPGKAARHRVHVGCNAPRSVRRLGPPQPVDPESEFDLSFTRLFLCHKVQHGPR
jgi:hypothetical protein